MKYLKNKSHAMDISFLKTKTLPRILVVGDIMLDKYSIGDSSRVSPEAPVPVVKVKKEKFVLGGAANVAYNTSKLGAETDLIGFIGNDEGGKKIKNILKKEKINDHLILSKNSPTTTKSRIISRNQQMIRIDYEEINVLHPYDLLIDKYKNAVNLADIVLISDYNKGTLKEIELLIEIANKKDIPVLVDPKGDNFNKYKNATLIKPNLKEFENIFGECIDINMLEKNGKRLRRDLNLEALVITRGENGISLIENDDSITHISTKAVDVFDVTGAGDTVLAILGLVLGLKQSFKIALKIANIAAGIVVGKLGTSSVSLEEIKYVLNSEDDKIISKIVELKKLKSILNTEKNKSNKIVMTNGCFDILHLGHVDYLQKAKKFGDLLIVAINDDNSISRLKGKGRPINNLEERTKLIAALECINYVIVFSEDNPKKLYCEIMPDVLVKGSDYAGKFISGAEEVKQSGGEIKLVDLLPGYSTTNSIEQIILKAQL